MVQTWSWIQNFWSFFDVSVYRIHAAIPRVLSRPVILVSSLISQIRGEKLPPKIDMWIWAFLFVEMEKRAISYHSMQKIATWYTSNGLPVAKQNSVPNHIHPPNMYFLLWVLVVSLFCWDPPYSHPPSTPSPPAGFVVREAADGTRIAKARVEQLAAALTEMAPSRMGVEGKLL